MHKEQNLILEIKRISQIPESLPQEKAIDALKHIHHIINNYQEEQNNIQHNAINHPHHYRPGTYEAINVIQQWQLNFALGNVIKYICRAGLKDSAKNIEDLQKALFYLNAEVEYKNNQR